MTPQTFLVLILAALTCLIVDVAVIFFAWRAAKRPVGGAADPPSRTEGKASPRSNPASESTSPARAAISATSNPEQTIGEPRISSAPPPAPPLPPSPLRRAWDEWWAKRDRFFTNAVKILLLLAYGYCLMNFFSTRTTHSAGGYRAEIGFPTAWFFAERHWRAAGGGTGVGFTLATWSWLFAALGALAYYIYAQVTRAEVTLTRTERTLKRVERAVLKLMPLMMAVAAIGAALTPFAVELKRPPPAPRPTAPASTNAQPAGVLLKGRPANDDRRSWVPTPDGPELGDQWARLSLKLEPAQIQQVNASLKAIHREFETLQAQHTQRVGFEKDHVLITIEPFPEEIAKLEKTLWSQLDPIMNNEQQKLLRQTLRLHPTPPVLSTHPGSRSLHDRGIFAFGDHFFWMELKRAGGLYQWRVIDASVSTAYHPLNGMAEARQLPEEYRRFAEYYLSKPTNR